MITHADPFGTHIRGIGRPRSKYAQRVAPQAARDVLDAIGFFEFSELKVLVRVSRSVQGKPYTDDRLKFWHIVSLTERAVTRSRP